MIYDLHEDIFASILNNLPSLIGLHVVGCPKLDHVIVFRHLSETPLLQSLSLTTSVSHFTWSLLSAWKFNFFVGKHAGDGITTSITPRVEAYRLWCPILLVTFTFSNHPYRDPRSTKTFFAFSRFCRRQNAGTEGSSGRALYKSTVSRL